MCRRRSISTRREILTSSSKMPVNKQPSRVIDPAMKHGRKYGLAAKNGLSWKINGKRSFGREVNPPISGLRMGRELSQDRIINLNTESMMLV